MRGKDWHLLEYPRRAGIFEKLDEMFNVRLNLTDAALAEMPALRKALHRIQTLRTISKDGICLIAPELAGLATPFADR